MGAARHIEIWTAAVAEDTRAALPSFGRTRIDVAHVETTTLSASLETFLSDIESIFEKSSSATSKFQIDEIELNLGVNAKGGVALIGKLEAGIQAGIKIKLRRNMASK